jgi:hypothetical protein
MNYYTNRTLEKELGNVKMGFDYLPKNYEFMSRHDQNNAYMTAMWFNEEDELNKVISQYSEFEVQEK